MQKSGGVGSYGCAANAYYGRDLKPEEIDTWPHTYVPDEIKTYWYNKDCYDKKVALCQKKAPDFGLDYNFYDQWKSGFNQCFF